MAAIVIKGLKICILRLQPRDEAFIAQGQMGSCRPAVSKICLPFSPGTGSGAQGIRGCSRLTIKQSGRAIRTEAKILAPLEYPNP